MISDQLRYVAFFKPYDVLTQFTDATGRATLKDYVPVPGVYPAGRLDRDSEGLLLLTDDGPLAHRLTDPRYEHPRTYLVQVERVPGPEALEALRRGVVLSDGPTRPAEVELLRRAARPARAPGADPVPQERADGLAATDPPRGPQPPGAADDRRRRPPDPAPGPRRHRPDRAGRPAPGRLAANRLPTNAPALGLPARRADWRFARRA